MRFYDEEALSLLRKAGMTVSDGNLVRIPARLMEWGVRVAPKRILMWDRNGKPSMALEGRKSYFGTGSDCLYVVDHRTGQRRLALLSDVEEGIRVCDAVSNVDFVMSMFLPSDRHPSIYDRYQMEAMLTNTAKPVVFTPPDLAGCRDTVEMAEVVAGGEEALRLNPFICAYINFSSYTRHNQEALQRLLYMAGKGLPLIYVSSIALRGVMTPVTVAGCLALSNAGQLAGLLLAQLKREGTPVFAFRTGGGGFDMRTMTALYSSPDARGMRGDLAHYYGMPTFGTSGCSDSKLPDEQASMELAFTLLTDTLEGSNLVHDLGYLESGRTGSLEMLVMCDEAVGWIKRFREPVAVNDETLALGTIFEADGDFIATQHTVRHYREDWKPSISDRGSYESWKAGGGKSFRERARDRVNGILAEHRPPELATDVRKRLAEITRRAERQIGA
jgi:trimethylamine--corrinoid protein Co-methyltransferase